MSKRFVSLLATVAIMLNLSIFSWGGSIPLLTETASAFPYETVSGEEITIYETDFEQGRHVEFGSPSTAEITAIGGWTRKDSETAAQNTIREWNGSSDNAAGTDTGNRVLFVGKTGTTDVTKWAQYNLPSWAKHSTGTYTYYFDFYKGSRVKNFWLGFADSIARDDSNEHECKMTATNTFNCSANYTWYRCQVSIDLDTHVSNWYSYAMDGTLIYHGSWQGTNSSGSNYSAALGGITNAPYISLEVELNDGTSNAHNQDWNFRLAAFDNLKITYQKSGTSAHAVTGNIYSNDFSEQVATNGSNGYYHTYGGWELYYGRSGVAQGKDGTTGFAPFAAPFKESVNASDGAAYYLPDDKLYCTGVYNVNFDMRIGADCTNPSIYYHNNNDSLKGIGAAKVRRNGTDYSVAQLATITDPFPKEEWVNVDMTVDLDNRTWTWYLKKADGTIWKAWDGTWDGEKVGAVEFYNDTSGTAVAAASNTDVTCNYGYVIDNFAINHYDGSMIYSEDFEHGSIHEYVQSQNEAGGWDYSGTAGGIVSTGYDSAHGFAFAHADGSNVTDKTTSSDYYIPKVHVHDSGVYSLTFNLYVGTFEDTMAVYLNDKDTWQGNSVVMAFSKKTDGEGNKHLDKGKWYKMKVNINLNTGSVQSWAYDPSTGNSVANNGQTYDRSILRHIAFRGVSATTGTVPAGGGPIMDNLIIHWFGTGSDQREMGESFDFGHLRSLYEYNASTRLGESTWDLYDRSGYANNHFVAGGVHGSAMAFAPVFRPGKARAASANESSEYWVDGSLIHGMGQWRIGFWYKLGASLDSTETLEFNNEDSFNRSTQEVIYTLTNSAIEKGKWYHLDAVLDFDLYRKNVRITDEKGNVVDEVNGSIGKKLLTYFSWHSAGGTAKTLTADDCLLIDDIGMIYNEASVNDTRVNEAQGITFDDENNKLSYQAKIFNELFIDDSANIKGNKAILAAYDGDDLVYMDFDSYTYPGGCPVNDYWTTHHRNVSYDDINGGNVDGLTFRMFLWDWNTDTNDTTGNPLSKIVEVTKPAAE